MDILDEIGGTLEDDYEDVKMEFEVNENTEGAKLKTNYIFKNLIFLKWTLTKEDLLSFFNHCYYIHEDLLQILKYRGSLNL